MFKLFKAVPITWMMLFVSGLIWAADNTVSLKLQIKYHDAQTVLGALGLLQLWDGDWWRIFTTAFHHGDAIHLLCNTSCLWWLGRLLETRMGSWRYALFCLSGIAVSGVAQSFAGPYVGLSGMLYAQFGLIWAWRRTDKWLQDYVQDQQIQFGLVWLFLCVVLTALHLMQIGNVAHFAGCIYGYVAGQVYFGSTRVRAWKPAFLIAHCCLIPAFYFVVHPVWHGGYHWRRGDVAVEPAEKVRHWATAVRIDPDLDGPWYNLASTSANNGDLHEAWDWILHGLRRHPSFQKAINLARQLWAEFPNRMQREAARRKLREIFGNDAPNWEKTITGEVLPDQLAVPKPERRQPAAQPDQKAGQEEPEADPEPAHISLPPFTLPRRALDEIPRPEKKMPAPNPNIPGSAEEGRST